MDDAQADAALPSGVPAVPEEEFPHVVPVVVRATIHLPDLPLGHTAVAMPDDPYVAMCVRSGYVIVEGPAE